ncbi:uncharacterized protein LOC110843832 isoform X2 [Folsomia candida]|uniref:Uncharacterized protein n=1 Tax=Folsomia candida TaxID=158441 RepID=A0A226ER40_FOLCA|nr:uncharacterized protein LOC110843832 isoform X2 [Folsomia candida]OXA59668.1 hypothetical protein Fcan01_05157 [Folsomia candida]
MSILEFRLNYNKHGMCCCNTTQTEAFIVIGATALITGVLWRSAVLAPIKLVAVFLHELSHALATWATCGKVTAIEVNENFGGVTISRGGTRWFSLSAGYIGSVIWGSFFILMTWDRLPTKIAAGVFIVACIVTAFVLHVQQAKLCGMKCCFGMAMRFLVIAVGAIPAALWVLEEYVDMKIQPLRWAILAIGTICTLHALYDCIHDVLCKSINNSSQGKSDAVMFAEEFCGTPRCWGLLWSMLAILAAAAALYGVTVLSGDC